jgi:hypothetical protein
MRQDLEHVQRDGLTALDTDSESGIVDSSDRRVEGFECLPSEIHGERCLCAAEGFGCSARADDGPTELSDRLRLLLRLCHEAGAQCRRTIERHGTIGIDACLRRASVTTGSKAHHGSDISSTRSTSRLA